MRRFLTVCLMASSIVLADAASEALAKGGRGRGGAQRGGGGRSVNRGPRAHQSRSRAEHRRRLRQQEHGEPARGGPHTDDSPGSDPAGHSHGPQAGGDRPAHERFTRDHNLSGREHALARQRFNEERKLQHRKGVASHLREVGERNGNQNLLDTADRMEQKAQEHYDQRMAKIDQQAGTPETGDPTAPGDPAGTEPVSLDGEPTGLGETAPSGDGTSAPSGDQPPRGRGNLHGRQNALERHVRNSQRQLEHHLQKAQQLRDTAAGDPDRLAAADQMEQKALQDYERRLDQADDFADRFGLTLPGTEAAAP